MIGENELGETVDAAVTEATAAEAPPIEAPEAEEAREQLEAEARRFGWKPEAEWKGDKTNWTDASQYLEYARNAPTSIRKLETAMDRQEREHRESIQRLQGFMEAAIKEAREKALNEAKAQMRAAVETGDTQAYEAAAGNFEKALKQETPAQPSGPDPVVAEWRQANPILNDPAFASTLAMLGNEALQRNPAASAKEQVEYADRRLREMGILKAPAKRTTAVDVGGFAPAKPRAKGWADIPKEDRAIMKGQIGAVFKDEAAAAKAYWTEYGA